MRKYWLGACAGFGALVVLSGCSDSERSPGPAATATNSPTTLPTATPTPTLAAPTSPSPTIPQGPLASDPAASRNGGGCYPTAASLDSALDMLTLVNPEWAPVVNGKQTDAVPIFVEGTILGSHGDNGGDFPSTHVRSDQNTFVDVDPAYRGYVAVGNDNVGDTKELSFEWEVGAYPDWAWGSKGDRIAGMGRWIYDCGHPATRNGHCSATLERGCALDDECRSPKCSECQANETCVDVHFGYSSELHPPYATAVMRRGRGGIVGEGANARAVPVTRTDIFIHENGGAASDACVVSHLANPLGLLNRECYPLSQPLARQYLNHRDFAFDVPLPPKPAGGIPRWRIEDQPHDIAVRAPIDVVAKTDDGNPHLEVRVQMTQATSAGMPTGYAGTLWAGWENDTTPLTHVRTTITGVVVHNPLQLAKPVAPKSCSVSVTPCNQDSDCPTGETCNGIGRVKQWRLQASVNGEWRELSGLEDVDAGELIPQNIVFEQYLPDDGKLVVTADGAAEDCINRIFGQSLKRSRESLGFEGGLLCLTSTPHDAGEARASFDGPEFGSGAGLADHQTLSRGGEGGLCSQSQALCLVDADCASGEVCNRTGGSFSLRYTIEKL